MFDEGVSTSPLDGALSADYKMEDTFLSWIAQYSYWVLCFAFGNILSLVNVIVIGFCSLVFHAFRILVLLFNVIHTIVTVLNGALTMNFNLMSLALQSCRSLWSCLASGGASLLDWSKNALLTGIESLGSLPSALTNCLMLLMQKTSDLCFESLSEGYRLLCLCCEKIMELKTSVFLALCTVSDFFITGFSKLIIWTGNITGAMFMAILFPFKLLALFVIELSQNILQFLYDVGHTLIGWFSITNIIYTYVCITEWIRYQLVMFLKPIWDLLHELLMLPWNFSLFIVKSARSLSFDTYFALCVTIFLVLFIGFFVDCVIKREVPYFVTNSVNKIRQFGRRPSSMQLQCDAPCSQEVCDEMVTCVICQDQPKKILLMPCRHLCLCKGCLNRLQSFRFNRRVCPICRTFIRSSIEVYI